MSFPRGRLPDDDPTNGEIWAWIWARFPSRRKAFHPHGYATAACLLLGRRGPAREALAHALLRFVQLRLRIPDRTMQQPGNLPVPIALNFVQLKNGAIAAGESLQGARKGNPIEGE